MLYTLKRAMYDLENRKTVLEVTVNKVLDDEDAVKDVFLNDYKGAAEVLNAGNDSKLDKIIDKIPATEFDDATEKEIDQMVESLIEPIV